MDDEVKGVFMRLTAPRDLRELYGLDGAEVGDRYVYVVKAIYDDVIEFNFEKVTR